MSELATVSIPRIGGEDGSVEVSAAVFGTKYNVDLVHQLVIWYLAGARQGTKGQKSRSEVSGGGAKPFRQKGTGRARAGSTRSPLWRTGGRAFAADNRDFSQKLNRKMYRSGLRSIFSELVRSGRLYVVPTLSLKEAKTKVLLQHLPGPHRKTVIVDDSPEVNVLLAARNVPGIRVVSTHGLIPPLLVDSDQVLVTEAALRTIEGRLQ